MQWIDQTAEVTAELISALFLVIRLSKIASWSTGQQE
jgi:hypothetical protein